MVGRSVTYFTNEYKEYIKDDPHWKALSLACRSRDKWTCQACGCKPGRYYLHAHHASGYDRLFTESVSELVSLCACEEHQCHQRAHGRATVPKPRRRRRSLWEKLFG